jgi:glutathione synthase
MSPRVRLLVVMDPIEAIKPAKDSTLAMLLAAQNRAWEVWYAEQKDLSLRDGVAMGRLSPLRVYDDVTRWFERGAPQIERLGDCHVILMRKDPPFDTEYIYTTYILERAQDQGAVVVNDPQGLRNVNEKVYTAWFPQCCAPTLITRDMPDMGEFLREHGKVVCKPLHGMGGRSIFVLEQGDKNRNVVFETLTDYGTRFAIVQRYLPEIVTGGDCRILLVDGEPRESRGRGPRREPAAERARPLAVLTNRTPDARGRHDFRRTRRHWRLCHRNQRHQPDRHTRIKQKTRYQYW